MILIQTQIICDNIPCEFWPVCEDLALITVHSKYSYFNLFLFHLLRSDHAVIIIFITFRMVFRLMNYLFLCVVQMSVNFSIMCKQDKWSFTTTDLSHIKFTQRLRMKRCCTVATVWNTNKSPTIHVLWTIWVCLQNGFDEKIKENTVKKKAFCQSLLICSWKREHEIESGLDTR